MDTDGDSEQLIRYSDAWWDRVDKALEEESTEHRRNWGDTDENLLARYVEGTCSADQRDQVERAMKELPAVRECVDLARELNEEWGSAPHVATRSLWAAVWRRLAAWMRRGRAWWSSFDAISDDNVDETLALASPAVHATARSPLFAAYGTITRIAFSILRTIDAGLTTSLWTLVVLKKIDRIPDLPKKSLILPVAMAVMCIVALVFRSSDCFAALAAGAEWISPPSAPHPGSAPGRPRQG